jgi:hypothetical protein
MRRTYNGENNPNWKGGRTKGGEGGNYIFIYSPTHPHCTKLGYLLEHRLVMEKHIGRTLLPQEIVHHINNDTRDNRIENLMLCDNRAKHNAEHNRKRSSKTGQFLKTKGGSQ